MTIDEFKPKHVPGLYSFDHFEHPNGAFIQRSHSVPRHYVYRDPDGNLHTFEDFISLRDAVVNRPS